MQNDFHAFFAFLIWNWNSIGLVDHRVNVEPENLIETEQRVSHIKRHESREKLELQHCVAVSCAVVPHIYQAVVANNRTVFQPHEKLQKMGREGKKNIERQGKKETQFPS